MTSSVSYTAFLLRALAPVLLFFLFFSGCLGPEKTPRPENLISEQNYIDLLVEMQHIKTYKNVQPDSISADSLKELVYQKFGITDQQYSESHTYYQQNPDRQLERIDEAIRQLEHEQQYIQAHIDSMKVDSMKIGTPDSARVLKVQPLKK